MYPVKAGECQQLFSVVSELLPEPQSCPRPELLENTTSSKEAGFGMQWIPYSMGLYSCLPTSLRQQQPSVKEASDIKIDNMRFRAPLLMEESSAFSKKMLLLSVLVSEHLK